VTPLNLFYAEPDPDRWIKYDRYPRKLIRRIVRGKQGPGGVGMIVLSLMKGLDKIGIPYRLNDYKHIKKHPEEIACIIGKPHVLFDKKWLNPIIFGAGIYSHPIERPHLFKEYPNVKRFLVPGEWMRKMCEPYYGDKVVAWPAGIDTDEWQPYTNIKTSDFLIYDKIRWDHDQYQRGLINPIIQTLNNKGLSYHFIKYGSYTGTELKQKLSISKAVIFLCEHETQGQAYQQILATNTPILAWDRGGFWQDPYYYPHKVQYEPVSSVPYWDERCGLKFSGIDGFESALSAFTTNLSSYHPRDYVVENLSLAVCAQKYMDIYNQVLQEMSA